MSLVSINLHFAFVKDTSTSVFRDLFPFFLGQFLLYLDFINFKKCIVRDTNLFLCLHVTILHQWRYREQYERAKDKFTSVLETPEYESHRRSKKISDSKYKEASKKDMQSGSFTTLPETRDTVHSKQINKLISGKLYKAKFEKEKGKSIYNQMIVPPDVQHAIDVAKCQSNVSYKKDAKANLHYTSVVDRPDIKKATQAAKLISGVINNRGGSLAYRPDIALATEVSKLNSQLKYKEKFDKEMKGKKPQYDLKDSKIYQTLKDASVLASEVNNIALNAFQTTQIKHLTLNVCGLFQVKYKEKYEKEKGKAMLDFETPTYVTAKEAQHMQSQVSTLSASSVLKTASNVKHLP
uniref:Nebulette n=1 Tax=Labrus bergylta TaxID=56723 RepID=A0A3Q3FLS3_9LABR